MLRATYTDRYKKYVPKVGSRIVIDRRGICVKEKSRNRNEKTMELASDN